MEWKKVAGYSVAALLIGGTVGYNTYSSGYDTGYYHRALEQSQALQEMEDRCEIREEAATLTTHQKDINFCDEKMFELQSELKLCQEGKQQAISCKIPSPSR